MQKEIDKLAKEKEEERRKKQLLQEKKEEHYNLHQKKPKPNYLEPYEGLLNNPNTKQKKIKTFNPETNEYETKTIIPKLIIKPKREEPKEKPKKQPKKKKIGEIDNMLLNLSDNIKETELFLNDEEFKNITEKARKNKGQKEKLKNELQEYIYNNNKLTDEELKENQRLRELARQQREKEREKNLLLDDDDLEEDEKDE